MIVYHWTPRREVKRIMESGLDPRHARSRVKYVWLADRERALEVVVHIAQHQNVHPSDLALLRVHVPALSVYSWARAGIYRSPGLIPSNAIEEVSPAVLFNGPFSGE